MQKPREERKQKGLCIYCGEKMDREGIHCTSCNKQYNTWNTEYRTILIKNSLCPQCGEQLDREGLFCSECCKNSRLKARIRNAERRALGLCVQCGEKAEEDRSYCRRCLDARMERYRKKKENS